MSLSWEFSDGQFTRFANSMATIPLSTKALGNVEVVDTTSMASPRTKYSTATSGSNQTSADPTSGSNFTLTFEQTSGSPQYTYSLAGTVNGGSRESLTIVPTITNDGPTTDSIHYCSLEFKIPPIGAVGDCYVMLPGTQSNVYPLDQVSSSTVKYSHPGLTNRGYASGSNPSDEPNADTLGVYASFVQWVYIWNDSSKAGLLLRSTDKVGQGKVISITRDSGTDELTIIWRFIPQDMSTGTSGASDATFAYGLEIRPMEGEDYDALVYIRDQQIAESHPAYSKGTIRDRVAGSTYNAWSPIAFYAMSQGGDTTGFDYTKYSDNVANIVSFFGTTALVGTIYDVQDGILGDHEPSVPYQTGAATASNAIHDSGVGVLLYTIPIENSKWDGTYGLPPASGIATDNLSLDRTDTAIEGGGAADTKWIQPSWLSDTNTDALYDIILGQHLTGLGSAKFVGVYDDAGDAYGPPPNDDTSLTAADRGIGSTTWWPKNRNRYDLWRTALSNNGVSNGIVVGEHPNEMSIGYTDFFFDNTVGPAAEDHGLALITAKNSQPSIMWSEYTRMTNFDGFGDGPDETDFAAYAVSGYSTVAETFASVYSFKWHLGHMPAFLRYFGNSDNLYFDSGYSAEYAAWGNFVKRLWFTKSDKVKHWHTCRRLRELPSSAVRRMRTAIKENDASVMRVAANKLHASVWHDTDNDDLAILISNWSLPGQNPEDLTLSDTLTTADYPPLDGTKRNIFKTNLETGVRTFVGTYDGSGSYTPNLDVGSGEAFLLEMVQTVIYYVDGTNGNDTTGDGSESSPYQTIDKVTSLWTTGDTMRLKGGNTYTHTGTIQVLNGNVINQWDAGETDKPIIQPAGPTYNVMTMNGVVGTIENLDIRGAGATKSGLKIVNDCDGSSVTGCVFISNALAGISFQSTAEGTIYIESCGSVLNGLGYDIDGVAAVANMKSCLSYANTTAGYSIGGTALINGTGLISYAEAIGILADGTGTSTINGYTAENSTSYPISITAAATVILNRAATDVVAARGWNVEAGTLNIRNSYLLLHASMATGGGGVYVSGAGNLTMVNCTTVNFSDAAIPVIYTAAAGTGAITYYNNISVASGTSSYHFHANVNGGTIDTNLYYPDGAAKFRKTTTDYDLSGWQTAQSVDANSIAGFDPKLRNAKDTIPNLSAVKLRRGSFAIGFGTDLSGSFTDSASGGTRPTGAQWSVGPHVFSPSQAMSAHSGAMMDLEI